MKPLAPLNPPTFLAPMEGVTDRTFRHMVVEQSNGGVGAACTEFLRVSDCPPKLDRILKELGPKLDGVQLGLQLMGNNPSILAASAEVIGETHADFIDLNFGCPAPKVFWHGAGSALLENLDLLEDIISSMVAVSPLPITAKIRSGINDDQQVEEIAKRVEQAGAARLGVHGRLRIEKYSDPADWTRIRRAVNAVSIPVIGNGGVSCPADIRRMQEETGCASVMVGRAAIGNPWFFAQWKKWQLDGQTPTTPTEEMCWDWLKSYAATIQDGGAIPRHALGKVKQSLKAMIEEGLMSRQHRFAGLRSQSLDDFFALSGAKKD